MDLNDELRDLVEDKTITAEEALERLAVQESAGEGGNIGRLDADEARKLASFFFSEDGVLPDDIADFFRV